MPSPPSTPAKRRHPPTQAATPETPISTKRHRRAEETPSTSAGAAAPATPNSRDRRSKPKTSDLPSRRRDRAVSPSTRSLAAATARSSAVGVADAVDPSKPAHPVRISDADKRTLELFDLDMK
ncbi:hypothetical protein HDU82_000471, partial [Entophlyctis luteolus]